MIRFLTVCAILAFASPPAMAIELSLPGGARQLTDRTSALDSYALPIGSYANGAVPTRMFEGQVDRQSWRMDGATLTTLQLLAPLREQIEEAGFEPVFECADQSCGGFDFRFDIEVIPAPDMHVDLRNYRFVAAVRDDSEALSLLISRSRSAAYVQVIRTARLASDPLQIVTNGPPLSMIDPDQAAGLGEALMQTGHVVLNDLDFGSGSVKLGAGPFVSLTQLAAFLDDHPNHVIAMVGHTDSIGALSQNIDLSKQRADAVRRFMIQTFGIASDRIQAEGIGYLAPIASNLTPEGREANRRVEAILLSER